MKVKHTAVLKSSDKLSLDARTRAEKNLARERKPTTRSISKKPRGRIIRAKTLNDTKREINSSSERHRATTPTRYSRIGREKVQGRSQGQKKTICKKVKAKSRYDCSPDKLATDWDGDPEGQICWTRPGINKKGTGRGHETFEVQSMRADGKPTGSWRCKNLTVRKLLSVTEIQRSERTKKRIE